MDEKQKKRRTGWRRVLMALIGLAAGALVYAGLGREAVRAPLVQVVTALPADLRDQGLALLGEQPAREENSLTVSGVVQADEILIASELGGRIAVMPLLEGEAVAAGDLLVQLDTSELDAQIAAAEALVAVAEAGLAQAEAAVRPGQIAVAEAQLAQVEAGRLAARQAISDTLHLVENPQDVQAQIAVTVAQIEAAEHQVAQATALKDAVELAKDKFEDLALNFGTDGSKRFEVYQGSPADLPVELPQPVLDGIGDLVDGSYTYKNYDLDVQDGTVTLYKTATIPLELQLMPNRWWQAWVGVDAALAQQQGLQGELYQLVLQRDNPQALQTQLDQALSALAQAEAQVAAAQAQLDGLRAGAAPEQLAALDARVEQARTAVAALQRQRELLTLSSPLDATVVSVSAQPGEVAAAGATLLTLANLADLKLTVYVPENRIGLIYVEQPMQVSVDSFPGQVFSGTVRHIAESAEFTPRHVATQEERVNLVFAVEIALDNPAGLLKPGMPAEVVIDQGSN